MPYIPPQNRPPIDERVDALAEQMAERLARNNQTAEISVQAALTGHFVLTNKAPVTGHDLQEGKSRE